MLQLTRRSFQRLAISATGSWCVPAWSQALLSTQLPEGQPFFAATRRLLDALVSLSAPLPQASMNALRAILISAPSESAVRQTIDLLDAAALIDVTLNPEMRVSVQRGRAPADLVQGGWRTFLIRVQNNAGATTALHIRSPQGAPVGRRSSLAVEGVHDFTNGAVDVAEAAQRWIATDTFDSAPMLPTLSGLLLEYRILQLYSRDFGKREASLVADVGWGEQDLGFRSSVPILFECKPAQQVRLHILDEHGKPSVAAITVRDEQQRIYPPMQKRELPDLSFQPQVYRYSGEDLLLPPGIYNVSYTRGPEYLLQQQTVNIGEAAKPVLTLLLKRWIDPSASGYYSGDTHIHAAGCSHYESPTEGVVPVVMKRQVDGEALDLGSVLNWGPSFRYQEQFFTGHSDPMHHAAPRASGSRDDHSMHHDGVVTAAAQTADVLARHPADEASDVASLLRYDVEVSGFPSSHCGHLVLLQLKRDTYPGAAGLEDWPSWNLPILRWAKSQGAVVGYAHSAHGLVVDSTDLPNYVVPPFDSMGANEFIVDVTHTGAVDFISGCDLWPFAELNIWYHTLNCGFRTAFAGETDFPCITDERVGGGRSYVALPHAVAGDEGYAAWLRGLTHGDSYVGDGRSHILHFRVNGHPRSAIDVTLGAPEPVTVEAVICARLEEEITPAIRAIHTASPYSRPYWHLERARVGESRDVLVEVVVNGEAVHSVRVSASGEPVPFSASIHLACSSWVALRIRNSSHTNPIFVTVSDSPFRPLPRSAAWCRAGVDVCWEQKRKRIRAAELDEATAAYEHARQTYDGLLTAH